MSEEDIVHAFTAPSTDSSIREKVSFLSHAGVPPKAVQIVLKLTARQVAGFRYRMQPKAPEHSAATLDEQVKAIVALGIPEPTARSAIEHCREQTDRRPQGRRTGASRTHRPKPDHPWVVEYRVKARASKIPRRPVRAEDVPQEPIIPPSADEIFSSYLEQIGKAARYQK